MKEMKITNPWLIAVFYKRDSANEKPPNSLTDKLTLVKDEENHKTFKGDEYQLERLKYYDTIVYRFSLGKIGEFSSQTWDEQRESLNQVIQDPEISSNNILGSSIVYWGLVDSIEDETYGQAPPTITAFGNLWQHALLMDERKIEYILLTPKNLEEKTRKHLLFATRMGIIKIDSHFHKANTEIREYDESRGELMGYLKELDEELITLLNTLRSKDIKKQREKLSVMTPKYAKFTQKVSLVNKLKNTLRINIDNYKERLEILSREKDRVYDPHIKRFERFLAQINHDLKYCQSTINSVHTGLDMLTGINSIATRSRGWQYRRPWQLWRQYLYFTTLWVYGTS